MIRTFLAFVLALAVVAGASFYAWQAGWISPIDINSEDHDSQIVNAIERTQEVALVRLSIQGIESSKRDIEVFGKSIPGTGQTVFLQYSFKAKLGIDGSQAKVEKVGKDQVRISVPKFIFIGYDKPNFRVAAEDGGALTWITPDPDKVDAVNKILSPTARKKYLANNQDVLKDQTKVFYDALIAGIDNSVKVKYVFN